MKRIGIGLVVAALGAVNAQAVSLERWNEIIDQTNVDVAEHCSGTLIDLKRRLVLTAHHCVDGSIKSEETEIDDEKDGIRKKRIRKLDGVPVLQYFYDGFRRIKTVIYDTEIAAYSNELDLAVVKIVADIPNTVASNVAKRNPLRGEPIKIVGNPGMEYGSIIPGTVSSVSRQITIDKQRDVIQVAGGMVGGNSGGAIYNEDAEIVGVAHAALRRSDQVGYIIPASSINKFIKDNCAKLEWCD